MAQAALIKQSDNSIGLQFDDASDRRIDVPGLGQVSPAKIGWSGGGYAIVPVVLVNFDAPGQRYTWTDETTCDGSQVTVTRTWTPWTPQMISDAKDATANELAANTESMQGAFALVLIDELNRHSAIETAIFAAAAAATSLADFKTRMAAISQLPQRSVADLRAAIKAKLI